MKSTSSDIKNFDVGVGQLRVNREIGQQRLVEEIDVKRRVDDREARDDGAAVSNLAEAIVTPGPKLP